MTPTETLKHEHHVILMVLKAAARELSFIDERESVHGATVEQMVDFFRHFADECHHAKEEQHLFPAMVRRGVAQENGPIGVMLHEHELGRGFVRQIAESVSAAAAGDSQAREQLRSALDSYITLLRQHIDKENKVLFPLADSVLTADDQKQLQEAFDRVEAEEIGEGVHEKYHQLAHDLAES
jgi:hemerythrin-like domain-containing protein